jgi:hypothetical protein
MFKRMFQYSDNDAPKPARNSPAHTASVLRLPTPAEREADKPGTAVETAKPPTPAVDSFEEIYTAAGVPEPANGYSILKIAHMLANRHLAEMTPDAKRNSLMMALEAAEIEIGELLRDAVARNRALDEYEENRQEQTKAFEAAKAEENNKLHAEMERLTSQYLARIQSNSDQVAREQDNLRVWQKLKQQESQRITDAATFCVPQGNGSTPNGLTAVLERVAVRNR